MKIAAELERAGWSPETEIILRCDLKMSQFLDAIEEFKIRYFEDQGTLGFIYYSGHGIAVDKDTYLFGVDSRIAIETVAKRRISFPNGKIFDGALRLHADLISAIGDAGDGSIFVVIDACRETPVDTYLQQKAMVDPNILKNWRPSAGYSRPQLGIKILYSTAYGALASDGIGGNSPFGSSFVGMMKKYGSIHELTGAVVKAVSHGTQFFAIKQLPDVVGELNPPPPNACLIGCKNEN